MGVGVGVGFAVGFIVGVTVAEGVALSVTWDPEGKIVKLRDSSIVCCLLSITEIDIF